MRATPADIPEIVVLEPKIFNDDRGFFFESFNKKTFKNITGVNIDFVQDNHSKSVQGVIRGLHYQLPPKAQSKLIRVIRGEIFDVAVDVRKSSPTFGQWRGFYLSESNKKQLFLPEGFAHGFLTLSKTAELLYKCSEYYDPECERCIIWNDPDINVDWPISVEPLLSIKDRLGLVFSCSTYL